MFKDYKSVIITILLFFLFRKKSSCVCESVKDSKDRDTFPNENNYTSDEQNIVYNEYTERAFEQDVDQVKQYYAQL
ncbi:hypothetical protein ACFSKN_02080 [Mariniflexile gromovii]|uniref:Uncharacterized protein n=1 Tax=Mariniflexile gromovii TaxID=362523 RepID=A0ABS4BP87_9FLAO|nr:hypothetical protein [Mariniflexile gromovii]MBP0902390.1 hypothetical protein [Mariniflexile gromovii]